MNGQTLDGRYEIVQVLGGGAFGKTFLAKDLKRPGRPQCVVKQLIYSSPDPQALEIARRLFKKEAETLEKLGQHNQIPMLLAEFEENQEFYLVQEYIDGYPLFQEMMPGQHWTENQVIGLLTDILQILVFVHGQGVIHRDIKPANLMRRLSDGKLVLIDFGSVKEIAAQIPNAQFPPTIAVGTPAYMPMEQFQGFPLFNSDIYALGMIAIQALLGLQANDLTKLPRNDSSHPGEVVWPNRLEVTDPLGFVVNKMVRLDPRQRYQSASEVLSDLSKIDPGYEGSPLGTTLIDEQSSQSPKGQSPKVKVPIVVGGIAAVIALAGVGFAVYNQLPQVNSLSFYNKGLEKYNKKDQSGAIKDFTDAININPNYAEAYYGRANAQFYAGNYQRSAEDATKAIEIKGDYAEAYSRRCAAYVLIQKNFQQAENDCTKALDLNPKYADAYFHRGNARRNLNKKEGALDDFSKFIDLNLDDPQAYINRGVLYIEKFQDYDKAITDYNQALKLAGTKPHITAIAYDGRGTALAYQEKLPAALEDFNKAIEAKGDFAQAYINRGRVYAAIDKRQEAIQDFQKADTLCSQQGRPDCSKLAQSKIEQLEQ
ncbi:MAG: serine/threonine-protein kinase [Nostoc sp.]|uniref:serine/threonine-protein kinase n=1 Tax=Nostoc sp. TaxID=1180 RepID=UPI002FFC912E